MKVSKTTSLATSPFFQSVREAFKPAKERTIQFTREAPLAAGATALSFAAFVSALTGSLSFITVFGAPAVALFACQIFNLMTTQRKK